MIHIVADKSVTVSRVCVYMSVCAWICVAVDWCATSCLLRAAHWHACGYVCMCSYVLCVCFSTCVRTCVVPAGVAVAEADTAVVAAADVLAEVDSGCVVLSDKKIPVGPVETELVTAWETDLQTFLHCPCQIICG